MVGNSVFALFLQEKKKQVVLVFNFFVARCQVFTFSSLIFLARCLSGEKLECTEIDLQCTTPFKFQFYANFMSCG